MTTHDFSGVNTTISVKEQYFLSREEWQQLVNAKDAETLSIILQNSPYAMSVEQLSDPDKIEEVLMRELRNAYRFVFEESPQSEIVEIFSAQYLYHNLKVLMKMKVTENDFENLLIDIGKFPLDALRHVTQTFESSVLYPNVVEEVNRTWQDYQAYQVPEAFDVGFDGAYFAHLRHLDEKINDPKVTPIINALIDFYNVIAIKRAIELDRGHGFMYTMMTSKGSIEKKELIERVEQGQLAQWFEEQTHIYFGELFKPYIEDMNNGTITANQLEHLRDAYIHQYFFENRLDAQGPLLVLKYIFGKENEINNLRLVLTGHANGIAKEKIQERMGAIYGETI